MDEIIPPHPFASAAPYILKHASGVASGSISLATAVPSTPPPLLNISTARLSATIPVRQTPSAALAPQCAALHDRPLPRPSSYMYHFAHVPDRRHSHKRPHHQGKGCARPPTKHTINHLAPDACRPVLMPGVPRRTISPSLYHHPGISCNCLGVAQPGSAPDLDSGGRRFKSYRPDQQLGADW